MAKSKVPSHLKSHNQNNTSSSSKLYQSQARHNTEYQNKQHSSSKKNHSSFNNHVSLNISNELKDILKPQQSIELLKHLHILTRDGKLNQDSRRKLKQVYHLYQFIEPLLKDMLDTKGSVNLVDHGAGKSYLGFILYDLFFKEKLSTEQSVVYGVETRSELVESSQKLAAELGFIGMQFLNLTVQEALSSVNIPDQVDVVTALHACDTATDDAITFGLHKNSRYIVVVPCCQAEVASVLRKNKNRNKNDDMAEIYRHPLHTREFGSHLTNVLRCLRLEAYGYQVTVTELIGFEHSMKNELIIAKKIEKPRLKPALRLNKILAEFDLTELTHRFQIPPS